jgi:hypothetical protein
METNPKDFASAENSVFNHHSTAATTPARHQVVFLKNVFTEEDLNFLCPLLLGMPTVDCNFSHFFRPYYTNSSFVS